MGDQQAVTEWIGEALQRIPSPETAKHKAIVEAIAGGWWHQPGALAKVSHRAGAFESQRIADEQRGKRTVPIGGSALMTNGLRGLNQRLWEALEPRIRELRRSLFGATAAPFETREAAAAWIEQATAHVQGHVAFLPYQKPGVPNVINRPVPSSGPIFELHLATTNWAADTNIARDALTMAALLDVQPALPPARVTFHFSSHAPCSASIHLYAPDLTVAQLRRIHGDVRAEWSRVDHQPKSGLSEADVVVLAIRKQLGPAPRRGGKVSAYWKRFLARMQKAKVSTATDRRAATMALLRAERHLQALRRAHSDKEGGDPDEWPDDLRAR